ncbi:universal stress protein [Ascidiimonas sp. W6]|uniref:universal stress protein n=1 Tax=Ascidiimonas meishanensis TaxID=3128903 RepID=UPI0030EBC4C8
MKRILVPTDFSELSEYALEVAAQIAKDFDAELFLMHSLDLPNHLATQEQHEVPEVLFYMKMAHQRFEEFMDKPYLENLKTNETIEDSTTADAINEAASKHQVDLIVMGSGGASGLKEFIIGSNTEKVVRSAETPVLVIKKKQPDFSVDSIVFACDFSPESYATFIKAEEFAKNLKAKIHFLYVNTPASFHTTQEITHKMSAFIEKAKPSNFSLNIYNDRSVEKGVINFSKSINADLISISTHGRKGLAHFFNGSISEDLANHALKPVLTFKIPTP